MKSTLLLSLLAAAGTLLCGTDLQAGNWNQKSIFTFSNPVEIPGRVLEPGTYVFKVGLGDSSADENVVEVFSKDDRHLVGLFLTKSDYRIARTPGKPIVSFDERLPGSPEAIRAWFYPGDKYGHEFVYPRSEAARLARANHLAVASLPDEAQPGSGVNEGDVNSIRHAHVNAVTPEGNEVETGTVFGSPVQHP